MVFVASLRRYKHLEILYFLQLLKASCRFNLISQRFLVYIYLLCIDNIRTLIIITAWGLLVLFCSFYRFYAPPIAITRCTSLFNYHYNSTVIPICILSSTPMNKNRKSGEGCKSTC